MAMTNWMAVFALLGMTHGVGQAAWLHLSDNNGNANEYYESAIDNRGKTSNVTTFNALAVKAQVPLYNAKAKPKVQLARYSSELSIYEFNCKDKTVQLTSRTFYADVDGKLPIVTHKSKDTFIQESNSEFARQFKTTPVYSDSSKNNFLMGLACK
jgi:hypothetical protein